MLSTLAVVAPIFALIALGWGARRLNVLGAQATTELNRFVVYLALPALLFDIILHARLSEIWRPGFVAVFGLSSLAIFAAALAAARLGRRALADGAIEGLNAAYPNTGYMGFPLAAAALGPAALAPTLLATVITVSAIFALAIVLIEASLHTEANPARLVGKVAWSLTKNPLVAAPALALIVPLAGLSTPAPVDAALKLLGASASPCALVTLGLFLGERQDRSSLWSGRTLFLAALKILVHPAATWVLAVWVFRLDPLLAHVAVLLSALPTGTGPFMLAQLYGREAATTSNVILVSTAVSVITVSGYLAVAA